MRDRGVFVLDGGLATELEQRGHVLDTPLWSASLLRDDPEAIRAVHLAYLDAGADCLITASYQASIEGFCSLGLTAHEAEGLIRRSVDLAREAAAEAPEKPLVAASIGPYGAYLADGSEYSGHYPVGETELRNFHEPRWHILVDCRPDLLACETIPSFSEAIVLRDLLELTPDMPAWVSFACRNGRCINDGTDIAECARLFASCAHVMAVGINCTAPQHIKSLIGRVHDAVPDKEVVVYPNSGEIYDPVKKRWAGVSTPLEFGAAARIWFEHGARLIGGCCRIGPDHIRTIRHTLPNIRPDSN